MKTSLNWVNYDCCYGLCPQYWSVDGGLLIQVLGTKFYLRSLQNGASDLLHCRAMNPVIRKKTRWLQGLKLSALCFDDIENPICDVQITVSGFRLATRGTKISFTGVGSWRCLSIATSWGLKVVICSDNPWHNEFATTLGCLTNYTLPERFNHHQAKYMEISHKATKHLIHDLLCFG